MNEVSESAVLVGQTLGGKYRLTKLLGEGGMGAVFLGEQKLGDGTKQVAIKVLHRSIAEDPKVRARFNRECGIVAQLSHPNTIQVFDFGEENGMLFIVMEYVQGRSVASILEADGPMDPARVERVMTQIVGSLEEAHSLGIVHRDLKPDNVVLCERAGQKDWVEVLDFGIAKRSGEEDPREQKLTQMGMVLGTPPYMSPEQFTGQPIDVRSDVYSLGVMTYEMLTGRLPFTGNTAYEWATQHMMTQPMAFEATPAGARVPPQMKAAVQKALEKKPEQRFQTVRQFLEVLSGKVAAPAMSPMGPAAQRGATEVAGAINPMGGGGYQTPGQPYAAPYGAPNPGYPTPQGQPHFTGQNAAYPHPGYATPQGQPGYPTPQGQAGYGTPPPHPAYTTPQGGQPGYGTPQGGLPYVTPGPMPAGGQSSGGGKGLIIALVLVGLGVAGVAIAAGLGLFSKKPPVTDVVATATATAPETAIIPTSTAGGTATTDSTGVATLSNANKVPTHPTTHPSTSPSTKPSATTAPTNTIPFPTATYTAPIPTYTAPIPTYTAPIPTYTAPIPTYQRPRISDPLDCQSARTACGSAMQNNPRMAQRCQSLTDSCIRMGGHL